MEWWSRFVRWFREQRRIGHQERFKHQLRRLQDKLASGRCDCRGVLFLCRSRRSSREMIACENQYGGEDLLLYGDGSCSQSIVDVELVRQRCKEYGFDSPLFS